MKKLSKLKFLSAILCFTAIALLINAVPASAKQHKKKFPYNPIIFVHGGAGSAACKHG